MFYRFLDCCTREKHVAIATVVAQYWVNAKTRLLGKCDNGGGVNLGSTDRILRQNEEPLWLVPKWMHQSRSSVKVMPIVKEDSWGIVHSKFVPKGKTVL